METFLLVWTNPPNAELNSICHLLALLGTHRILHISRIMVNEKQIILFLVEMVVLDGNFALSCGPGTDYP
jgi:hypothetical protein